MKLSLLIIASDAAPSVPGVAVYRPKAERLMGPLQPEWTGEVWTVTAAKVYDIEPADLDPEGELEMMGARPAPATHRVTTVSHWSTREEAEEEAARCRVVDEDDAPHTAEASVAQAR